MINQFVEENFRRHTLKSVSSKPRIEFIDLAKGVCILLVVFMHCGYLVDTPVLSAIRMPLYFILSGLFYKDYGGIVNFLVKKANKLLIPLLFFMSMELVIRAVLYPHDILGDIVAPFVKPSILNFPIWFLLCLFWVNLLYFYISTNIQKLYIRAVIVFSIGCIGAVLGYAEIYLPLFFSSALSATPFFFIGVMFQKLPFLYKTKFDKTFLICGIIGLLVTIAYCVFCYTPRISFVANSYQGNVFEIYLISVIGVFGLLVICKALNWLPIVSYLGRYSIMVLGLHIIFRNYAYLPLYLISHHIFSKGEILLLTLLLCWISIPIMKRFFSKFTAQHDIIKLNQSPNFF